MLNFNKLFIECQTQLGGCCRGGGEPSCPGAGRGRSCKGWLSGDLWLMLYTLACLRAISSSQPDLALSSPSCVLLG